MTDIDIKNSTCYFFDDVVNIKNLGLNKINTDEKSYKNILVYYNGYATVKDQRYVQINNANFQMIVLCSFSANCRLCIISLLIADFACTLNSTSSRLFIKTFINHCIINASWISWIFMHHKYFTRSDSSM